MGIAKSRAHWSSLIMLGSLFFLGCAHHRDVRPGPEGVHRVVVQTEDTEEGSQDAIAQANHYCKESNKQAAFLQEDKKYTGNMSEEDYKRTKTFGKVAQGVGGTVWALGGKKESSVGGLVGLGGSIANSVAGKGYTIEMRFKCQ